MHKFLARLIVPGNAARAVLDATGTETAVIAGASQGGAWALALAARHPRITQEKLRSRPQIVGIGALS